MGAWPPISRSVDLQPIRAMPKGLEGRVLVVFDATADRSDASATRFSTVGLILVAEGGSGFLTWQIHFNPLR